MRDLSVAEQQLVEIAKALSIDSSLLIMDEPTAALGLAETHRLLALIRRLAAQGVGLVPEDRKADGLFFNFEGPQNITIARLRALLVSIFLSLGRERQYGREYVDKLGITPTAMDRPVQFLSGGNQQKVMIARWLFTRAKMLIMDEPTRGIDIGAKIDVYNVINELTKNGIGVLLISSDYPELLAMSDRVAIVRGGRILHIADAQSLSEHRLASITSGAEPGNLAGQNNTGPGIQHRWLTYLLGFTWP